MEAFLNWFSAIELNTMHIVSIVIFFLYILISGIGFALTFAAGRGYADLAKGLRRILERQEAGGQLEDIVELSHTIDDVTDSIEDILLGMYMYNITKLRPEVNEFCRVISRCCAALSEMTREMCNVRKSTLLQEKVIEINELEEEGDRLYTEAMRRLYVEERDPVAILAWTTMFDRFEKCCDGCEDVADHVEQVIMKNS